MYERPTMLSVPVNDCEVNRKPSLAELSRVQDEHVNRCLNTAYKILRLLRMSGPPMEKPPEVHSYQEAMMSIVERLYGLAENLDEIAAILGCE